MEEKRLYPLTFCTIQDDYAWGSEEFKLADLGYRDNYIREGWLASNTLSELMDMYMDRVVGDNVFEFFGRQFPFQVKRLDVNGRMPLRVHPDDETAAQRYDSLGKEKFWYVLKAGSDARAALGFVRDTDAGELYDACVKSAGSVDGSAALEALLNIQALHTGDCLHIAPGTVHAAAGDVTIIEVSESSPMDFCLSGWGVPVGDEEFDPALTLVDALDFIDYRKYVHDTSCGLSGASRAVRRLIDISQFTVSLAESADPLHIYSDKFNSCLAYYCLEGGASIRMDLDGIRMEHSLKAGELVLVPADCPDFVLEPVLAGTRLLEITVGEQSGTDAYINPEADEKLPEDE